MRDEKQLRADISRRIREIRLARGLTQEEIAVQAKMKAFVIRRLEQQPTNATLRSLARIANALGEDPISLFVPPADAGGPRKRKAGRPRKRA